MRFKQTGPILAPLRKISSWTKPGQTCETGPDLAAIFGTDVAKVQSLLVTDQTQIYTRTRLVASGGAGGGRGGNAPRFSFLPPRFISCPSTIFFGRNKWPERTFKFVISARKNLRILTKTFFFFGDHLIFTKTSPQSNSGIIKNLCPPDFNFALPISRSWRRP